MADSTRVISLVAVGAEPKEVERSLKELGGTAINAQIVKCKAMATFCSDEPREDLRARVKKAGFTHVRFETVGVRKPRAKNGARKK